MRITIFSGRPFWAYLSGVLFESSGELNDAFISYQQAEEYYERASSKTGVSSPRNIGGFAGAIGTATGIFLKRRRFTGGNMVPRMNGQKVMANLSSFTKAGTCLPNMKKRSRFLS